jgi:hypothetical protein
MLYSLRESLRFACGIIALWYGGRAIISAPADKSAHIHHHDSFPAQKTDRRTASISDIYDIFQRQVGLAQRLLLEV